jgi:TolB-like protein/class 3 adenylate cyclase/tetratricopeptide (TPR) repeat protein
MSAQGVQRRLAAILSADVVGYSRLMAEDEEATVRTVAAYREQVGLLVAQHRGRLVDSAGDSFLAEFASALGAVQCALEIQSVLAARNARLAQDHRMQLRVGVHLGDIRLEGERVYGDGVNIAARLQALAEPGGICVSAAVQEQVGTKLTLSCRDLGPQSLKNIPGPVRAYSICVEEPTARSGARRRGGRWALAIAAAGIAAAAAAAGWRLLAPVGEALPRADPIRSLAVLPLENLSGDPEQAYFADGMTEALIGDLARIAALRVISRTSVMQYKGARKPLREIARELDVEGVLEGTVQRVGDRVRITAQLIDARSDAHLWSERYDRALSDVLILQSDLARAVAEQVRLELSPKEHAALSPTRTVDPRAYDAYVRGLEARGHEAVPLWAPRAIAEFERAVELDPNFAEGWAALGDARVWLAWFADSQQFAKARDAAQRALDLDDRSGKAHSTLASVLFAPDWDFEAARHAAERALELAPSDPTVLDQYIWQLVLLNRTEQARPVMERLLRVAPLDRVYRANRMRNFYLMREYDRALEELEWIRGRDPGFAFPWVPSVYAVLGRFEEAHRAQLDLAEQLCGPRCQGLREAVERGWREGGWEGSIRSFIGQAAEREGLPRVWIAENCLRIGAREDALAWLERAYQDREPVLLYLNADPVWDPLRSDPRFQDLLRRIGFPESG